MGEKCKWFVCHQYIQEQGEAKSTVGICSPSLFQQCALYPCYMQTKITLTVHVCMVVCISVTNKLRSKLLPVSQGCEHHLCSWFIQIELCAQVWNQSLVCQKDVMSNFKNFLVGHADSCSCCMY